MQNVVHMISSVETNPTHTQISIIRRFWKKLRDFSLPFEIIPRLNALFTPFYMQNVVHMISSVEASPGHTQIAIIRLFERKLGDISFPFVIFRRLNATFTPFYMQNVVRMISIVETSPETRKSQSVVDFDED